MTAGRGLTSCQVGKARRPVRVAHLVLGPACSEMRTAGTCPAVVPTGWALATSPSGSRISSAKPSSIGVADMKRLKDDYAVPVLSLTPAWEADILEVAEGGVASARGADPRGIG